MDTGDILSIFLRGALGARGRKRARRARNFLVGHRGFLTASGILTAAGVAWGIYDSMKPAATGAPGAPGAFGGSGALPPPPGAMPGAMPPPLPGIAPAEAVPAPAGRGLPDEVLRLVRLAVSAARADGTLAPAERALILRHARDAGIESAVDQELTTPQPLGEIVGGISDAKRKQDLYVLAFTIIRADESVSGAERVYLAQLAHQLGLDAATAARLEQETATKIDAQPDESPDEPVNPQ